MAQCPEADILVNNNAGPKPGTFQDWDHDRWMGAIEGNMLAPIFMIRALLPGMRERKFGRIVNITSAMVKAPRPHQVYQRPHVPASRRCARLFLKNRCVTM